MQLVIVTGMSGAGKSAVLRMLEDYGFFCVDNLPVPMLPKLAEMSWHEENLMSRVALGIDIRSRQHLHLLEDVLKDLKKAGYGYEILFLDCSDAVLIKRYKETRRTHPLMGDGRLEDAIKEERQQMQFLKSQSEYIIDTSRLLVRDLKQEISHIFVEGKTYGNFFITLVSFGFKYGIPADADLVFDVRFLPNPYYVESLKSKTGNDADVYNYVMASDKAGIFIDKLYDMLVFLIPEYIKEGKNRLVIGIGCTGGHHRSVTITNALYERLKDLGYGIKAEHRDIANDQRTALV